MKFTILVTEDCNLNCKYCYEGNKKKRSHMNLDIADKAIEFILEEIRKNPNDKHPLNIVFHGGEPLLNFEAVKYIYKSLNELVKDRNIIYDMTSNGTLLSEEIKYFIKHNLDTFSISIDGIKESHDENRVFSNGLGSYDLVINNSKKLLDEGIELRARMTFNEYNVKYLYESVKSMYEFGFKYIVPAIDFYGNWGKSSLEVLSNEIDKLIRFKKNNKKAHISLTDIYALNSKKGDCFGGICSFCIDTNGIVYPCTFAVNKDDYIIGDIKIKNCLNIDKIEELKKVNFSKNSDCTNCTRYEYCRGSRCKILNKLVTDDYYMPPKIVCFEEHMNVKITKELLKSK